MVFFCGTSRSIMDKPLGVQGSLVGCQLGYGCHGLRLPERGHVLAPWVAIEFENSGSIISVGNHSSNATNPKDVAVIKSFEYGHSDGLTVKVVIHDQQGGSFAKFMENILKHHICLEGQSPGNVAMKYQFGWVKSGCPDPVPIATSPCYFCLTDSVETNYTGGKFIFEITGKDIPSRMFESSAKWSIGENGENGVSLKEAIRTFMTKGPPPNVKNVRFVRLEGKSAVDIGFEGEDPNGPSLKWEAAGRDKLTTVRNWLSKHPTDRGKAWVLAYNSQILGGELLIWEDPKPGCFLSNDWDFNCLGTYIVNGGKKSPVIEFNPRIRWDFGLIGNVGGAIGSMKTKPFDTEGSKIPGRDCPGLNPEDNPGAGQLTQVTEDEGLREIKGGDGLKTKAKEQNKAMRAIKILHDNIEADLVIVGDPTLIPPIDGIWHKNVSIVLINPYYITDQISNNCGEWLSQPICNEVLSNKAWTVKSVTHRIDSGSYTTTLGVYLAAPGVDSVPFTNLGGWAGGWKPVVQCRDDIISKQG